MRLANFPGIAALRAQLNRFLWSQVSVDLVTAAQAFHWFGTARARVECLRVLRPDAKVALIWNDRDLDDPLQGAINEIFGEYGGVKLAALAAHEKQRDVTQFFGDVVPQPVLFLSRA